LEGGGNEMVSKRLPERGKEKGGFQEVVPRRSTSGWAVTPTGKLFRRTTGEGAETIEIKASHEEESGNYLPGRCLQRYVYASYPSRRLRKKKVTTF